MLAARPEKEIQLLLIHFAGRIPRPSCATTWSPGSTRRDRDIAHAAFRALRRRVPRRRSTTPRFLGHEDFLIRNLAAESLGGFPTARSLASSSSTWRTR